MNFNKRVIKEPEMIKNTFLDFRHKFKKLAKSWNWNNPYSKIDNSIKSNNYRQK